MEGLATTHAFALNIQVDCGPLLTYGEAPVPFMSPRILAHIAPSWNPELLITDGAYVGATDSGTKVGKTVTGDREGARDMDSLEIFFS